ncbi:glycosyltransferase family 39 protein [Candidatus Woesearchaeota archaeon]|nr:glycosyltransferase family 39 protein [Candidatus Woesearchaeota archaeon]
MTGKEGKKKETSHEPETSSESPETIEFSLKNVKKWWPWILLVIIVLFGFYLRYYHVDYPVIGYHNWKETHYLTEARNFARDGFFAHGFFAPAFDYPQLGSNPTGAHSDTFPLISVIVAIMFKIIGPNLWAARMVGILFSVGSIIAMYLFAKKMFHREEFALFAAALTALSPLFVFFSHNVDLINPGLFFMLLTGYYYLSWREDGYATKQFVLMSLFFVLAGLTKYPFMVIAIPIFFTLPWQEVAKVKKHWKEYSASLFFAILLVGWMLYANTALAQQAGEGGVISGGLVNLGNMFSPVWWSNLKPYLMDNYTMLGWYLSLLGLVLFLGFTAAKWKAKQLTIGDRFLFFCFVATLVFILIMSEKMKGHSYHQFPMAPFVLLFLSFGVVMAANTIGKIARWKGVSFIVLAVVFLLLLGPSLEARNRQFDTQFIGLDIAGEYINSHSTPDERIIHSGHQDYGIFWHADRKGTDGGVPTAEGMQRAEKEVNAQWLFLYQWGLQTLQEPEKIEYINKNYGLQQAAFRQTPQGPSLFYLLLKKGGTFDVNQLNSQLQGRPLQSRTYESTSGTVELMYVNME